MTFGILKPISTLVLPYDALKTVYKGPSEVRLYENTVTHVRQVGKRVDLLGLDDTLLVHEAQVLKAIDHPNIVPVLDVAEVKGDEYRAPMAVVEMVMPFFPRGSVFDALDRGERFSVVEAIESGLAALRGLDELHRLGILHRDVKSPNVLVPDDSTLAKIADLGVAAWMDDDRSAEAFPSLHPYTPPETYSGNRSSPAGDLYGMGLILLEMASRPLPYATYTTEKLAERLEHGQRGPSNADLAISPHVPPRLRTAIRKSLTIDPSKRFQTAGAFADALVKVRAIDWERVLETEDEQCWEGQIASAPGRRFRVDARRGTKGWRLSGLQNVGREWRRCVNDDVVGSLYEPAAAAFFDAILDRALRA